MDQGVSRITDRSEFLMTDPSVWKVIPLNNGLREMDDGIIFPDQCQSKGKKGKKNESVLYLAKVRSLYPASWEEAVYLNVSYISS